MRRRNVRGKSTLRCTAHFLRFFTSLNLEDRQRTLKRPAEPLVIPSRLKSERKMREMRNVFFQLASVEGKNRYRASSLAFKARTHRGTTARARKGAFKSREVERKTFFSIIISISSHRRRIGQSELTGTGGGGETWQKNAN